MIYFDRLNKNKEEILKWQLKLDYKDMVQKNVLSID
jgi:hypothetical protein